MRVAMRTDIARPLAACEDLVGERGAVVEVSLPSVPLVGSAPLTMMRSTLRVDRLSCMSSRRAVFCCLIAVINNRPSFTGALAFRARGRRSRPLYRSTPARARLLRQRTPRQSHTDRRWGAIVRWLGCTVMCATGLTAPSEVTVSRR